MAGGVGRRRRAPAGAASGGTPGAAAAAAASAAAAAGAGGVGAAASTRRLRPGGVDVGLDRQQHRERRALARLRAHLDRAAVVLDDALADRQPEAGALLLRRVERDEQVLEIARAGCRRRCRGSGPRGTGRRRGASTGAALVEIFELAAARASPAARSATGSGTPAAAARRRRAPAACSSAKSVHDLDLAAGPRPPSASSAQRLLEHVGDVELPLLAAVRARVVEELRHDLVQPVHLLDDDVEELARALGGGRRRRPSAAAAGSCAAPLIAPSGLRISCARPAAIWPSAARRSRSFIRS